MSAKMELIKNVNLVFRNYFLYFILTAAFVVCYFNMFLWLNYKYQYQDSYYSHGYMIPFISAYLVYLKWDKLKKIEPRSNKYGLAIIVFSFLIYIISTMGDVNFIGGFSIFFFISGCTLYLYGGKITKELAFPIIFLLFMFPIPNAYIDFLGLPTKSVATTIGLKIIDLIGIPYYKEGFRIELANTSLFVGTPCNGMKSLISFAAIGVLALYILDVKLWKKIIILIGIYPLAIVLNGMRIASLVYIAHKYGIEKASPESFLHDLSGIVVFIIGLLILFVSIMIFGSTSKK